MLDINGLSISYGAVEVVHGVTMHIDEGKIVALIGPNGAGKSSVLRAVSGLIRPSSGDIAFLGASLVGAPPHEIAAAGIAHVMEGRHLFAGLTVEDNLLLAGSGDGGSSAGSMEAVFQRWPILRERQHQLAGNLSGGEQQMLAICRALMARPRLVMLDEPSWGLAPRVVRELIQTIEQLRSEGITILLVEQMAKMALKICDYGYLMTTGRIVLEGSAQELLSNPDLQARYLGGKIGAEIRSEKEVKPPPEATVRQRDVRKTAAGTARLLKEKERREKAEREAEEIPAGKLQPPLAEPHYPKEGTLLGRERLRQIRQQSFGSDKIFSDLKEELGRIRKEVSGLKEVQTIPEDKTPLPPLYWKKDWHAFEKQRRERQAHWKPEELSGPETKVSPRGRIGGKDWMALEAARKKRQVSLMRETKSHPSPSKETDLAGRERERKSRQEKGNKKSQEEQETNIPSETRLSKDYKQLEMKRRERERTQGLGYNMKASPEKRDKHQVDWKSRELARQQRRGEMEKKID